MKRKGILIGIVITIIVLIITIVLLLKIERTETPPKKEEKDPVSYTDTNFNINLIKTVNSTQTGNYLISPYSIEIALNMLKEGSSKESREELENVISNREIPDVSIKNRVGIANALFIKEDYKEYVNQSFVNILKENYHAEVIYDKFDTPDKINEWVNEKTNQMIDKILDDISEDYVLGVANALAVDVKWYSVFECVQTKEETFKQIDGTKKKVEMMYHSYEENAAYFETNHAKGVILPYARYDSKGEITYDEGSQLEFVAILPNQDVSSYLENLEEKELQEIEENQKQMSDSLNLNLWLPRFRYDFELEKFKEVLLAMGIQRVFNPEEADLTGMMTRENMSKIQAENLYVSTAIHKTHIDLNEEGTKAAAVTYFGIEKSNAAIDRKEPDYINIKFDKSFAYMIRDTKTKEILFFGVVDEPNEWEGNTCSE